MPPQRRKSKEEKALDNLKKLLGNLGVTDLPTVTEQDPSYEAEAVLSFLETPRLFVTKVCKRKECRMAFSSNYQAVAYCSNACRALALAEKGIRWDQYKTPEQRWGGTPPLIVGPDALACLVKLASQSQTENQALLSQTEIETPEPEISESPFSFDEPSNEETKLTQGSLAESLSTLSQQPHQTPDPEKLVEDSVFQFQ